MQGLKSLPCRLSRCNRAATAVEYGLIVSLIVLAMLAALTGLADVTTGMWGNVSNAVQTAR